MNADDITRLIRAALPEARVSVASADNTHFEAIIVDACFAGKTPVERHKTIYAALGAHMGREIHALSMQTLTPAESESVQ